jgi:2-oxoglutarate dehydrogenase E2 component (dihydrolipoamide succinyltransferase)
MVVELKVPALGESITEGTLSRWLKPDGASVRVDERVYELETEKATTEIAAPVSGTLRMVVKEGQTVAVGTVVGRIEEGAVVPVAAATPKIDGQPPAASEAPALSPAVREFARKKAIDVRQVTGSGRGGRVTMDDLRTFAEKQQSAVATAPTAKVMTTSQAAAASPAPSPVTTPPLNATRESRQRMSSIRQRIAQRLVEAQNTAAILSTFNEADLSRLLDLRTRYKESFAKKHGVGLGFMSFFVKASVAALQAFPTVNASIDGQDIVYHQHYDIGVAVSTEKGLMVPVLRDADQLSFAGIEKGIAALADKARAGKITVDDLQGGTFTITNGGVFGSLLSTPILNPPQSGILGMHAVQKRPIAIDDQVVVRPMMYLALSYDHRLIDGREAVSFLVRVKECIENPERLLLEV